MADKTVLRWGRSAYETDAQLAIEERLARAQGLDWRARPELSPPSDLHEIDALVVTSKVRVGDDELAMLRGDLVLTTTSGTDHIDLAAAERRGVAVARCPEARRDAVVEHALWGLMHMLRAQPQQTEAAREGRWARADLPDLNPRTLCDARIVVVGLGEIGGRMADLLLLLGARVAGVDPKGAPDGVPLYELDDVIERADAITLHCSLTDSSRNLLSAPVLDRLPDGAVVVNTSRGAVLDVDAAVERVRSGKLGGLVVDVFPEEPWPRMADAQHPKIHFTPHGSGVSGTLGARVAAEVGVALAAWASGHELPNRVV